MANEFTEYVPILETHNAGDRVFIKSILEAEGITYFIQGEYVAPYLFNALPMRVMVRADQAHRARAILKDIELSYSYGGKNSPGDTNTMQPPPNQSPFKHCPKCGDNKLSPDSVKSFRCAACDFVFYLNPAAAVAGLLVNPKGELLVVERNHDPAKGTWDLPGGFIEPGESYEQGLRREIREELNIDIMVSRYFCSAPNQYAYGGVEYSTVDAAFICEINPSQTPYADMNEIISARFLPLSEIKVENFGLPSIRMIVSEFLSCYQCR